VTNTGSLSFTYDALGRRVQVAPASGSTNYVYDGLNGIEEQNSSGGVTADMLGGGLHDWFTRTDSSGTNTMLRDGMNSTNGLVNSSGSLATQFTYEPFGRTTFSGSGTSNLYRFTSRELDGTGLYFMRARYYNPVLQRFLSPDPLWLGGGSPDLYAYALNSPTNFIDPLGLSAAGTALGAIGGLYGCTGGGPSGSPNPGCVDPGCRVKATYTGSASDSEQPGGIYPYWAGTGALGITISGLPSGTPGLVAVNATVPLTPPQIEGVKNLLILPFAIGGGIVGRAAGGFLFPQDIPYSYWIGGAIGGLIGGWVGRQVVQGLTIPPPTSPAPGPEPWL
jgi:RHS repeat-associated protein